VLSNYFNFQTNNLIILTNSAFTLHTHSSSRMDPAVASITMRIVRISWSRSNSIDVQLEHANMVIDPRHMGGDEGYEFRFSVKGRILTITRIDDDGGWNVDFCLRAFLSTDAIPDFTSTIYTYYGIDGERAPKDVTELNFHPSVRIIKKSAFKYCEFLVRVTIPDSVTRIEQQGFAACHSLRFLRLSINLESIGVAAFYNCYSLEAVFLPPTVTLVSYEVFSNCESLRFCILPDPIEHLGRHVFLGCDRLSRTVRNNLSRVCYSTSVTRQAIHECIHTHGIESATEVDTQQMTALHILCANPHVTSDCIGIYLQLAPEAAEQQDFDGMTPFQYLCRNDITFFDDRSFCSVIAWWYHCMP